MACLVGHLQREHGLPDSRVYLPRAVGQCLMSSSGVCVSVSVCVSVGVAVGVCVCVRVCVCICQCVCNRKKEEAQEKQTVVSSSVSCIDLLCFYH